MKTSTRMRLGAAVLGFALVAAFALTWSGRPLVSFGESHTMEFPGGSATMGSMEVHWPLGVVALLALPGLAALVWPARQPPRLPG